jgi:hypothetical protein
MVRFTLNVHGTIAHAVEQLHCLVGNDDVLENDLEHLHQITVKITACVSWMKIKNANKHLCILRWRPSEATLKFMREWKSLKRHQRELSRKETWSWILLSKLSRLSQRQITHVHSKMEATRSNIEVHERVEKSQEASKKAFKKRNMKLDSTVKAIKAKTKTDDSRI